MKPTAASWGTPGFLTLVHGGAWVSHPARPAEERTTVQPSTAVLEHVLPRVASWRRHAVSATEDAPDPRSGPSTAVRRWLPARPAEGYDDEVSAALDDNHYNNSFRHSLTFCYATSQLHTE